MKAIPTITYFCIHGFYLLSYTQVWFSAYQNVSVLFLCPSLERDAQLKERLYSFNHTDKDLHGAPVGSTAFTVIILQK